MNTQKSLIMHWKPVLLLFLALVDTSLASHSFDGGSTGDNGNDFIDGTPDTDKAILGATCFRDDDSMTDGVVEFLIYHNDMSWAYEASASVNASKKILFKICEFIDAKKWDDITESHSLLNCAPFTVLDADGASNTYGGRTFGAAVNIDFTASVGDAGNCGGYLFSADKFHYAVHCRRDPNMDMDWDIIFRVEVSDEADDCLVSNITSSHVVVGNPDKEEITRNFKVTSKLYKYNEDNFANGGIEVTGSEPLGTNLYWDICLEIEGSASPEDLYFANNGIFPNGIFVHSCTARPDGVGQANANENQIKTIVDENGCGKEETPAEQFANDTHIFQYVVDSSNPAVVPDDLPWTRSPNCFRSRGFEAQRFRELRPFDDGKVIFSCALTYCKSFGDSSCFGDDADAPGDSYDTLCTGNKRKRRQADDGNTLNLPERVEVTLQISAPEGNGTTPNAKQVSCFEKNTFIGLSSGLGVLLLTVLVVAVYLAIRLWRDDDDEKSTDSMTGIKNKAYY